MNDKIGKVESTRKIIDENNFYIKKKFGQNFLTDSNILNKIVESADIDDSIDVLEIGPGLGALTEVIAKKARRVLAYEIDKDLIPILNKNLIDFNNITIVNDDILKRDINKDLDLYFKDSKKIVLIANLPYYITTPIILTLLEQTTKIKEYVMMMQEEVADRITSKPDVKDYNALSIAIQYRAKAYKVLRVPSTVFIPRPLVDSAVIRLDLYDKMPYKANNEEHFFKLVRASFAQRRKTLMNNLVNAGYAKDSVVEVLSKLNLNLAIRSEALSVLDFVNLSNELEVIK